MSFDLLKIPRSADFSYQHIYQQICRKPVICDQFSVNQRKIFKSRVSGVFLCDFSFQVIALPDLVSRDLSTEKQNFCSVAVTKPHHQSPTSPQEKTKQNKKNTHPLCNLKKYTVLAFKCSGGFIVYFFNSSKYQRTHFSHYRTAEAAIACCTLKQSNENNVFFLFGWNFRKTCTTQ